MMCIYKDMSIYFLRSDSKASHTVIKHSTTKLQLQVSFEHILNINI